MTVSAPPPRTSPPVPAGTGLVTVTARISLVLAVLGVAWSLLQTVVAALLPDLPAPAPGTAEAAFFGRYAWLLAHRVPLSVLQLGLALAFLSASWGLLRRLEWARWLFIGLLLGGAAANFAGVVLLDGFYEAIADLYPAQLRDTPDGRAFLARLQVQRQVGVFSSAIAAVGLAALHGWLAWKLCTAPVRAGFRRAAAGGH